MDISILFRGGWSLVAGHWLLVAGRWLLVAGHWALVAGYQKAQGSMRKAYGKKGIGCQEFGSWTRRRLIGRDYAAAKDAEGGKQGKV